MCLIESWNAKRKMLKHTVVCCFTKPKQNVSVTLLIRCGHNNI